MPASAVDLTAEELAIRTLVARYADAVTDRDTDAFAATWASDGEWNVLGRSARGRDDLVALLQSFLSNLKFVVQQPSGGVIDWSEDPVRGRWGVTEYAWNRDGGALLVVGRYDDVYRREGGEWRFASRTFEPYYLGPPDQSAGPIPKSEPMPEAKPEGGDG